MNVYENKYLIVCEKFIIQFFKNITKIGSQGFFKFLMML